MDDVLVHGCPRRDEDRDAGALATPGPPELLPGRGDGPGIAREDGGIQPTDVDAEFEGVRRDDPEDLAVTQSALDRPPLGGQVAASVAADPAARPVALAQRLTQPGEQDLDRDPRTAEHDRLPAGAQERQGPALGEGRRRAAGPARRLDDRRVDEQDVPLAGWRPGPVDDTGRPAGQRRRQLTRVPDGRRAAHDDRVAPVMRADPQQPSEDVRDVPAEHPAIRVQLVDDDDLELLEELEPFGVVGEDRGVEHVRVGHDHLSGRPDRGPDRGRGVPVIGGGHDRQASRSGQLAELGHLVLPKGLGREQEERPRRWVVGDGLERRHRVAQRLARRGRGDDHDILAGVDGIDRLRLVRVGPLDPARCQPRDDPRVQPGRESPVHGAARRDHGVMHDTTGHRRLGEQVGEDGLRVRGGVRSHAGDLE